MKDLEYIKEVYDLIYMYVNKYNYYYYELLDNKNKIFINEIRKRHIANLNYFISLLEDIDEWFGLFIRCLL